MTKDCMGKESSVLDCSVCHDRNVLHYMRGRGRNDLEEGDEIEVLRNESRHLHPIHGFRHKEGAHRLDGLIDDRLNRGNHGADESSEGRRHPVEETL